MVFQGLRDEISFDSRGIKFYVNGQGSQGNQNNFSACHEILNRNLREGKSVRLKDKPILILKDAKI